MATREEERRRLERQRRDTPAQQRAATDRAIGATRRENRRVAQDVAATDAIRRSTAPALRSSGPSGSSTPRRALDFLSSRTAPATTTPFQGEPITQAEVRRQRASASRLADVAGRAAGFLTENTPVGDGGPATLKGVPATREGMDAQRRQVAGLGSQAAGNISAGQQALGAIGGLFGRQGPGLITDVMQARSRAMDQARNQPMGGEFAQPVQPQQTTDAMGGQGFYTDRTGGRVPVAGTRQAQQNLSVLGDFGAATNEFARAADIRAATTDRLRPGFQQGPTTVVGQDTGVLPQRQAIEQQIALLTQRAGSTRNQYDRARLRGSVEALQEQADRLGAMERAQLGADTDLRRTQLGEEGATERAAMQIMAQSDDGMRAYNEARAEAQQLANEALRTGTALEPPVLDADTVEGLQAAGRSDLAEQEVLRYQAQRDVYDMGQIARSLGISVDQLLAEYAAGEIPEGTRAHDILSRVSGGSNDVQRFADGGLVGGVGVTGAGIGGQDPVEAEYQEYAQGAQRIGVQPIPFEQFMEFRQPVIAEPQPAPDQTQPFGVMGFADGGYVPQPGDAGINAMDVSGRQVIDPDPNAPTDSIPAVIDGRQPAALDSGEFVIPDHVVRFHGLKALQKLIDQAEQSNGSNPGTTQTA